MKSYKFGYEKLHFEHEFTSSIGHVIGFTNHRIFVYFEVGRFLVHDFKNGKTVNQGPIKKGILEIFPLNQTNLAAYVDRQEGRVKVFDIDTGSHVESLFKNLPTTTALGSEDRSDQSKIDQVLQQLEYIQLPRSSRLVFLERAVSNDQSVLTVFDGDASKPFFKQAVFPTAGKIWKITSLNDDNLIAIWSQEVSKTTITFSIWNIDTEQQPREFTTKTELSGILTQVLQYSQDKLAFFLNIDEQGEPQMQIYDLVTGVEESHKVKANAIQKWKDPACMLCEALDASLEQNKVILMIVGDNPVIALYNPVAGQVLDSFDIQPTDKPYLSVDKQYMYQFPSQYEKDESENRPSKSTVEIFPIFDEKLIYLYLLQETGILESHGRDVAKLVLNILSQ